MIKIFQSLEAPEILAFAKNKASILEPMVHSSMLQSYREIGLQINM